MNVALVVNSPPADPTAPFESTPASAIARIADALSHHGYSVDVYEADAGLGARLALAQPEIAFNYARGPRGLYKAAYAPITLEALGVPCSGSDALTLATCADKITLKELARRLRIQSPDAWLCNSVSDVRSQFDKISEPMMVKPNNFDLGVGVYERGVCRTLSDLIITTNELLEDGLGPVLVERFVHGREIHCVILGTGGDAFVLPPVEVVLGGGLEVMGDEARVNASCGAEVVKLTQPAGIHSERMATLQKWALAIYRTAGVRDFGVVEFIIGQNGVPYLIEVNAMPDITPIGPEITSVFETAMQFEGIPFQDVMGSVLNATVSRFSVTPRIEQQLHMGFADEEDA